MSFQAFDIEAAARRINNENRKEDERAAARRKAAQLEARRIAVEGGDVLELVSITEASSFAVDLIDISGAADEFARLVRAYGILL
jgi:hypothetical protein